jgi:hypothetical protein
MTLRDTKLIARVTASASGKRGRRNAAERPLFVLTLRPEPGVDGTRALRRFLKVALRSFRLRCISAVVRT